MAFSNINAAMGYVKEYLNEMQTNEINVKKSNEHLKIEIQQLLENKWKMEKLQKDLLRRVKLLEFALEYHRKMYMKGDVPVLKFEKFPIENVPPRVDAVKMEAEVAEKPVKEESKDSNSSKHSNRPSMDRKVYPSYKLKLKLSGHLDSVRRVCFHPTEAMVVSGSEDGSIKVWNLASKSAKKKLDIEPVRTWRGHTEAVCALEVVPESSFSRDSKTGKYNGVCIAGGRDGCLSFWNIPDTSSKAHGLSYEAYQSSRLRMERNVHEDVIWDIHAHPTSNTILTASADASVRIWAFGGDHFDLQNTISLTTTECAQRIKKQQKNIDLHASDGLLIPTSVVTLHSDMKTCMVGYTASCIGQYDIETAKLLTMLVPKQDDAILNSTREAQVVSHPSMPLVFAAHHDKTIRMYDLRQEKCVFSMKAHQDSVTSISIDDTSLYLVSGSHDGSMRCWSIAERSCIDEHTAHRRKYLEAVHTVHCHATRGFIASGGADGIVKVYQ